jgi:tetratricopeptide (TPR) repeat protein
MFIAYCRKIISSYRWRPWHACLIFAAAIVIIYSQSLFFNYSYLDDQQLILENADILERANPAEIFLNDVFFSPDKVYYRPLLTWSLALDWHWGGGTIFSFHFSNLLFHIIAACLLFYLLRTIRIREETSFWLSFFFAIHPALVQAVAWVPGRNDSLAAIFIFSTLLFLSRWFRQERLRDLLFLWFFFLLALLTKETAVLLPLFAAAWIFIFERGYFTYLKFGLAAAGASVAGLIWYLLRSAALGQTDNGNLLASLWHNLFSPVIYLGKVIFPFNLSVYPVLADVIWPYGIIAALIFIAFLYFSRPHRYSRLAFGLIWFWLFLILGLSRPDSDSFQNFMEHRLYVPIFGLIIIAAETENFWRRLSCQWRRRALLLVITVFVVINVIYTYNFRDRVHFWQQATKSSPHSALANRNLGAMYYLNGDKEKAEIFFRRSLSLNIQEPMAHNNLALIYMDRGDLWRAEMELKKELAINPNYDLALYNLGRVYYERRRYQEAASLWQRVLRINPRYFQATLSLEKLNSEILSP